MIFARHACRKSKWQRFAIAAIRALGACSIRTSYVEKRHFVSPARRTVSADIRSGSALPLSPDALTVILATTLLRRKPHVRVWSAKSRNPLPFIFLLCLFAVLQLKPPFALRSKTLHHPLRRNPAGAARAVRISNTVRRLLYSPFAPQVKAPSPLLRRLSAHTLRLPTKHLQAL